MSYARWGWEGSDVYVYLTNYKQELVIQCCGCFLEKPKKLKKPYTDILGILHEVEYKSVFLKTSGEAVQHFNLHREKGDTVPQETIDDILKDFPDINASLKEQEKKNDFI